MISIRVRLGGNECNPAELQRWQWPQVFGAPLKPMGHPQTAI
jgi:hypothetical protein